MAVVLVEGFDAYNGTVSTSTAVGLNSRWTITFSGNAMSAVTPYSTGQSVSFTYGTGSKQFYISVPANSSGSIGFAFYVSNYPSTLTELVQFSASGISGTGRQFGLCLNTNGNLSIGTGTGNDPTSIYATTNAIVANTWNYIELEFTISDTVGTANIYVNGALFGSASGLDTKSQAAATTYSVLVFGPANSPGYGITGYYDDLYLTDTATRLGEQRVVTVVPTSDGTPSQWAASGGAVAPYTMVDEVLCNGDTDYIYDGTVGDRAVFNMGSTGATPLSVSAVQIGTFSRKTDTGARSIQLQYVDGGGTAYNSSNFALGASYARQLSLLQTNPATSTSWTPSEANALKAGVRISV